MTFASVLVNSETEVKNFIQKVVTEGELLISEVEAGLQHVAVLLPSVTTQVQAATAFVEGLGIVSGHPEVVAAAQALTVAVQGVNEFANAYQTATSGGSITATQGSQAIMAGYQGFQATKAAVHNLVSVATAVAKKTPPGQAKKVATPPTPVPDLNTTPVTSNVMGTPS